MPLVVHLLTSHDFLQATVRCGARATYASPDPAHVTCPACLGQHCTCGPATTPCPACRAWNRQHGARQTTPPGPLRTEKAFQEVVRRLALDHSWLYFHTTDARKSPSGYPDCTLVHPATGRGVFAELKMPGKRPTMAQQTWLDALAGVTHVQTFLWTPDDLETILGVLQCETP